MTSDGWKIFPLWWVEHGSCVCPKFGSKCTSPGKHPIYTGWRNQATNDKNQIAAWTSQYPKANWGLATGVPSGVFVLDIDVKSGGFDSLKKLPTLPDTLEAKTGSGGRHFYFTMPEGKTVRNSASAEGLGPGIDVRGTGGFVVIPPSVGAKGTYEWLTDFDPVPPPEFLLKAMEVRKKVKTAQDLLEGQRNNTLISIGGRLRSQGAEFPEINKHLQQINLMTKGEPLDSGEVETIAGSASGYAIPEPGFNLTDEGTLRRFIDTYGSVVRHSEQLGWLVWDGKRWARSQKLAFSLIRQLPNLIRDEARSNPMNGAILNDWATKMEAGRKLQTLFQLAKDAKELDAPLDLWDADPWLLNVENGILELRSGSLVPHSPEHLLTKLAPVTFNAQAVCPMWETFLDEVLDAEIIPFLQRSAGYWLTGVTYDHAVWFFLGQGRNGKGTIVETLSALLGPDYAQEAAIGLLESRAQESHTTDVAELRGLRFVTTAETSSGRKLNDARLKQYSGGDRIKGRYMRQDNMQFPPTHKLLISGNNKPVINDVSVGMWERIKLVKFGRIFHEDERDVELPERLLTELPGILNWCLAGLQDWMANGLQTPESVKVANEEYQSDMDPIGEFLRDHVKMTVGMITTKGEMYTRYVTWANAKGEHVLSLRELTRLLRDRGHSEDRKSTARLWLDMELKSGS